MINKIYEPIYYKDLPDHTAYCVSINTPTPKQPEVGACVGVSGWLSPPPQRRQCCTSALLPPGDCSPHIRTPTETGAPIVRNHIHDPFPMGLCVSLC